MAWRLTGRWMERGNALEVNLMVFLARAMKSIAWADRTSAKARREVSPVDDPDDIDPVHMSSSVIWRSVIQRDPKEKAG